MKYNLLLLETIVPKAMSILEGSEDFSCYFPGDDFDDANIHGVMTRGKGRVTKELIDRLPSLKTIARIGVGVDNVAVDYATSKGIQVLNTPGENASTIAEHAMVLMLMLQRNLYHAFAATKTGDWESRTSYHGDEIRGKKLGVIGMGDIGEKVGHLASAFGMEVIYWNRSKKDVPFQYVSLERLVKTADIITIHLPLTEETEGILDKLLISNMKTGCMLINTARGRVLDEMAVVDALNKGKLGGYAADVLRDEPGDANHPLMMHAKTLITPHIGSLTKATFDRLCILSAQNLMNNVRGENVDTKFLYNKV